MSRWRGKAGREKEQGLPGLWWWSRQPEEEQLMVEWQASLHPPRHHKEGALLGTPAPGELTRECYLKWAYLSFWGHKGHRESSLLGNCVDGAQWEESSGKDPTELASEKQTSTREEQILGTPEWPWSGFLEAPPVRG